MLVLAETYSHLHPFLGIVLAGAFTPGSLEQLRSSGFTVAHVPYTAIVRAFATVGIDAGSEEGTAEDVFRAKILQYKALSPKRVKRIKAALLSPPPDAAGTTAAALPMTEFLARLEASLSRGVQGITVVVLHGAPRQLSSISDAIAYLQNYDDSRASAAPALKYEIDVRYNNGDVIHGIFQEKGEAIRFLRTFG